MSDEYHKEYYQKNREQIREKARERYLKNRDADVARSREYRKNNLEACREREKQYNITHAAERQAYHKQYQKSKRDALRQKQTVRRKAAWDLALAFFGPCACCGESRYPFLTIDHINGGGNQKRASGERYGWGLIMSFDRAGWPESLKSEYRVLCCNCNQAVRYGEKCPHEIERE